MRDHRAIDERSLALCQAIGAHLEVDPGLVNFAKGNITRWKETCSPSSQSTLEEWEAILNSPIAHVFEVLTARRETATRLRQSNPFAGVLIGRRENADFQTIHTPKKE